MKSKPWKTVFKFIRGRVVPIRVNVSHGADELQKIKHIQRARDWMKKTKEFDPIAMVFVNTANLEGKQTGASIAKRISRLRRKK